MEKINKFYDVVILGAGPAGFTAAVYTSRAGLKTLIIEKETPGGKVTKTYEIENYPPFKNINGADLGVQMFEHSQVFGAEYVGEDVIDVEIKKDYKLVHTNQNTYKTHSIIVATGTKERQLHVKGENKYFSKGVSTCAVCDGALYKNQDIAVVGGGLSATEEGIYLTRFAKKVFLIHRRQGFRAPKPIIDRVKNHPKMELYLDYVVEKIMGDGNVVNSVIIRNVKTNKLKTLKIKCIFPYIGQIPNTQFLEKLNVLNSEKYIEIISDKFDTKLAGIYAAGDVIVKTLRQVANAVGDGANAGQAVVAYVDSLKLNNAAK